MSPKAGNKRRPSNMLENRSSPTKKRKISGSNRSYNFYEDWNNENEEFKNDFE